MEGASDQHKAAGFYLLAADARMAFDPKQARGLYALGHGAVRVRRTRVGSASELRQGCQGPACAGCGICGMRIRRNVLHEALRQRRRRRQALRRRQRRPHACVSSHSLCA